jgi:hypothetical protein
MSKRRIHIGGGTLIWDDGAIGIMLRGQDGEVAKDVQRRAYAVQKRMKRLAPRGLTGELQRGIHVESAPDTGDGPASRIVSLAPHTIVNEVGRGPVVASGLLSPSARPVRKPGPRASGRLQWGSDRSSGAPTVLTIKTAGGVFLRPMAGEARGSRFMENSIDAALD